MGNDRAHRARLWDIWPPPTSHRVIDPHRNEFVFPVIFRHDTTASEASPDRNKRRRLLQGRKKSTWAITWPIRHSWSRFKMGVPHLSSYIYTLANAPFWHFSHFTGGKVLAEEAATVPYIKVWVIRERDCDPEGDAAGMQAELKSTDSCNSELSHLSRETKTQSHNIEDVIKRRLTTYPSRCENFLWTYSENWSFKQSIKECVKGVGLPKM